MSKLKYERPLIKKMNAGMMDNRVGAGLAERHATGGQHQRRRRSGLMDVGRRNLGQLGNPASNIRAIRIVGLALSARVENAKRPDQSWRRP